MKRFTVILIGFLVLFSTVAFGQNQEKSLTQTIDGYYWGQMSEDERTNYLAGYISAMRYTGTFVYYLKQENLVSDKAIKEVMPYIKEWIDYHYQIGYLQSKITKHYNESGRWDTPLARVVLIVTGNRASLIKERLQNKGKE